MNLLNECGQAGDEKGGREEEVQTIDTLRTATIQVSKIGRKLVR